MDKMFKQNFKKPLRAIIIAAVALAAVLSVGFAVNRMSNGEVSNGDLDSDDILRQITLDELRELAAKGDSLQYSDFPFRALSGLSSYMAGYNPILYGVEGGYRLLVNFVDTMNPDSGIKNTALESIWESGGSGIDIRYHDVDEFIRTHSSHPVLTVEEMQSIVRNYLEKDVIIIGLEWWERTDEFPHHSKDHEKHALDMALQALSETCDLFMGTDGTFVAVSRETGAIYEYDGGKFIAVIDQQPTTPLPSIIQLYSAQLVHDGSTQNIEFEIENEVGIYALRVTNGNGGTLWQADANFSHVGWNTVLLTRWQGKDYLMVYHPEMYQGNACYSFRVFSLDDSGNEIILDQGEVAFSINPPDAINHFREEDVEPIKAFFDRLEPYLAASELLMNTDENAQYCVPAQHRDRVYGTQESPITGLRGYLCGTPDTTIDEQLDELLQTEED